MINKQKILEDQLKHQKRLNSITNRIHSAKDTKDILLELHGDLLGFFDADRLTVYLVDGAKREIFSKIMTGEEIREIRVSINYRSLAGYCAVTGKLLNIGDVYGIDELKGIDSRLNFDKTWDQKTGYRTKQALVVPITYNKYLLGVIQLINKKGGQRFTVSDQSAALDISKVLGIAFFKNQKIFQPAKSKKFDFLRDHQSSIFNIQLKRGVYGQNQGWHYRRRGLWWLWRG